VIIVQANVQNNVLKSGKVNPCYPGYKNASGKGRIHNEKDDTIIALNSFQINLRGKKKKKFYHEIIFVIKVINQLKKCVRGSLRSQRWIQESQISTSFLKRFCQHLPLASVARSTKEMLSLTIYLMLLRQNIESNPGMNDRKSTTITIVTFNCNGLREQNKLKRLLLKVSPIVKKGGIVLLQETHLTDTKYLSLIWKDSFASNCVRTNSAGVLVLFSNNYKIVEESKDVEGRSITLALKSDINKIIISNSYFPNDHKISINFAESVYLNILEMQHKYPEYQTIAAGDYNACLNLNDSLNRNRSNSKKCLAETIKNNNKITNLEDSYRAMHKDGGYTWRRRNCYSRLDYICISSNLLGALERAEQDWSFENSDHAAVKITLKINTLTRGPGIPRVNTKILEDPKMLKQIEDEINIMMNQTDQSWNPHSKLEFFKVAVRSVLSSKVSETRKNLNSKIEELEEEFNQLSELKINVLHNNDPDHPSIKNNISTIDIAITSLRS
jgi:exonuclease III